MTSNKHPNNIHKDITKRYWLTDELQEETGSYYPSKDEIRVNPAMGNCARDLKAFVRKRSQLFPVGRVFLSKL